jgi:hypothetical protein
MRFNLRGRVIGAASASALVLTGVGMVASVGTASAAPACGDVITTPNTTVTLTSDIGPCPGNGITVAADGVTLNLAGHTITGSNTTNGTANEQVGVLLQGVRNVLVENGTIRNFDAGIAIQKGSKNTVRNVVVHDNINHSSLVNTPQAATNKCNYGDGVTMVGSNNNLVTQVEAFHNGPFSGISIVDNSDNNIVNASHVYNQTVFNELPPAGSGQNGPCGPFSATPTGAGRLNQDVGIRVEGPGADGNQVTGNTSNNNMLNGISIHGYVCWAGNGGVAPPGAPQVGLPNTGNLIQANTVKRNGFPDGLDGIGILRQGPFGNIVCASHGNSIIGNTSIGNAGSGIFVPPTGDPAFPSASNTVNQNIVNNNGVDGITVQGPFTTTINGVPTARAGSTDNTLISNKGTGNARDDGFDGNPNCDHNFWQQNIFGTVNQPCVADHGGTGTVTGPIPVAAP